VLGIWATYSPMVPVPKGCAIASIRPASILCRRTRRRISEGEIAIAACIARYVCPNTGRIGIDRAGSKAPLQRVTGKPDGKQAGLALHILTQQRVRFRQTRLEGYELALA
jgi:hypothetical protein